MKTLKEQVDELRKAGYRLPAAQMKVAHDVILLAMHRCGFKKNSTVKGGVVMSHITGDIRRSTMDMDIAFVRRSISDASVASFVKRINCIKGVRIAQFGTIEELKHEDYRGKRVCLDVSDGSLAKPLRTKVDIGVHAHKEIAQVEYLFELSNDSAPAELNANSGEQIFAEKLLSLLRYGPVSRRPKDAFDMYYLRGRLDVTTFVRYVDILIYRNPRCEAKNKSDVIDSLERTFASRQYLRRLHDAKANWLQVEPERVMAAIIRFLRRVL